MSKFRKNKLLSIVLSILFLIGIVWAMELGPEGGTGGTTNVNWYNATPAGADTYVQYNDSGVFGGEAAFVYDKTNNVLTIPALNGVTTPALELEDNGTTYLSFDLSDRVTLATSESIVKILIDDDNSDSAGVKYFQLFAGDHDTRPTWQLRSQGDTGLIGFQKNSDGTYYGIITVDSNGIGTYYGATSYNGILFASDGDVEIDLNANNGSDYFRVQDSNNNDVFRVSDAGVTDLVDTTAKITIVDDGTSGSYRWHIPCRSFDATLSQNEAGTTYTYVQFASATNKGVWSISDHVPHRIMNSTVVLDRITISYVSSSGDATNKIDTTQLISTGKASNIVVEKKETTDRYSGTDPSSYQFLTADVYMENSRTYWLEIDIVADGGGGQVLIYGIVVAGHLENIEG